MSRSTLTRLAAAVLALSAVSVSVHATDADTIRARWMANANGFAGSARPAPVTVGFVGCDMHAPGGPQVALIQIARGQVAFDTGRLLGRPCADALVRLQSHGFRLGTSRIVPGTATTDPDCLAWDIIGPEV